MPISKAKRVSSKAVGITVIPRAKPKENKTASKKPAVSKRRPPTSTPSRPITRKLRKRQPSSPSPLTPTSPPLNTRTLRKRPAPCSSTANGRVTKGQKTTANSSVSKSDESKQKKPTSKETIEDGIQEQPSAIDLTKNNEPRSGSSYREFDLKIPSFEEYSDSRNEADQDRKTTSAELPSPLKVDSRNQKRTLDGKLMQQVKKRHTLEIQKIHEENVKLTARLRQEQEERAQAMHSEKEDTIRKLKEEKEGIIQALRNENQEAKRHENEARVNSTLLDDLMSKNSQLKQENFALRNQLSVQQANTQDRICKSLSEENERSNYLQRKLDDQESSVASLKLELEKAKSDLSKITQQARLKPELLPPSPLSIAGSNKRSFSVAPAIGTSHSLEEKSDNIRRVFLRVKRKYDTVHSLVSKLVTDTRGLNLSLFGEFGQHIGSLRKLLEEEAKERIIESGEQQESVGRTNGSV